MHHSCAWIQKESDGDESGTPLDVDLVLKHVEDQILHTFYMNLDVKDRVLKEEMEKVEELCVCLA